MVEQWCDTNHEGGRLDRAQKGSRGTNKCPPSAAKASGRSYPAVQQGASVANRALCIGVCCSPVMHRCVQTEQSHPPSLATTGQTQIVNVAI